MSNDLPAAPEMTIPLPSRLAPLVETAQGYARAATSAHPQRAYAAGVRRTHGRPPAQKEALLPEQLIAMLDALPPSELRNLRDRAILLLGFAGGLRRSEITGLDCGPEDSLSAGWPEFLEGGVLLTL